MNEFIFLPLLAIILFVALFIAYYFFNKSCLFVFAIGCVIASNTYNIGTYGFEMDGIIFGLDSILYSMFVFCILIAFLKFGKKDAMEITYTSMGSLGLTAVVDLLAKWCINGSINTDLIWGFVSFLVSILGTYIAIYLMILAIKKLKNNYLQIIVGMLVASVVNSFIYFGLIALFTQSLDTTFGPMLAGSYIGKAFAMAFCLITYMFLRQRKKKTA